MTTLSGVATIVVVTPAARRPLVLAAKADGAGGAIMGTTNASDTAYVCFIISSEKEHRGRGSRNTAVQLVSGYVSYVPGHMIRGRRTKAGAERGGPK